MVLKPAIETPWSALRWGRLIAEKTDIPAGVVNIVPASDIDVAQRLVAVDQPPALPAEHLLRIGGAGFSVVRVEQEGAFLFRLSDVGGGGEVEHFGYRERLQKLIRQLA